MSGQDANKKKSELPVTAQERSKIREGLHKSVKAERKKRASLYTYFLVGFTILITAVLILGVGFIHVNNYLYDHLYDGIGYPAFQKQVEQLKGDNYGSIQVGDSLGEGGYFEVVNEDAEVLYSGNPGRKNTYTKEMLQYIPDMDSDTFYAIEAIGEDGSGGYLLSRYKTDYLEGTAILDKNGNIIYSNMEIDGNRLTEREIHILSESSDIGEYQTILMKNRLTTSSGEARYLLIHLGLQDSLYENAQGHTTLFLIVGFIVLIVLLIMLTALFLVRKIRRPLNTLDQAISGIAEGNREPVEDYRGPKEFVHVINTFNSMEEQLRDSETEQKKLQEQKQRMLADISHDLKTPITVIRGYVNAINDGLIGPEEQKKYLTIVSQKTVMLEELINSFSDYSRLEHPEFRLNPLAGDICEYFREYLAGKYRELELAGYDLEIDIPEERIPMEFDHMQLKRVFENIITNSLRYTDPGTTIIGRMFRRDTLQSENMTADQGKAESIVIELGDNGPGIPEQYRSAIFDPFVTGDEARTSGKGTGLGLSIAKKIVEQHGGSIELVNQEEHPAGTLFRIIFHSVEYK